MSLTEIAYWIATEGGAAECVISNVEEAWKPALRSCSKGLSIMMLICWLVGMARGRWRKSRERCLLISAFTIPSKIGPSIFFQMSPTWSALALAPAIICTRNGNCTAAISELGALKSLDFGPFESDQRVCLRSATTARDSMSTQLRQHPLVRRAQAILSKSMLLKQRPRESGQPNRSRTSGMDRRSARPRPPAHSFPREIGP